MLDQSPIVVIGCEHEEGCGRGAWPPTGRVRRGPREMFVAAELPVDLADVVDPDLHFHHEHDARCGMEREHIDKAPPSLVAHSDLRRDQPTRSLQPARNVGDASSVCPIPHRWRGDGRREKSKVDSNIQRGEDPDSRRDREIGDDGPFNLREHLLRDAAGGGQPTLRPSTSAACSQDRRGDSKEKFPSDPGAG